MKRIIILIILVALLMNLEINLTPKQKELYRKLESTEFAFIGYGGARGGGKSRSARDLAITLSFKYQIPILIFRRVRKQLLSNHVYPMLREHPELRKYFNKSELTLYDPINGEPRVKFGAADRNEDIYDYQGDEYAIIFVDEATRASKEQITFLRTCNRDATGRFPRPKMVYTMNPGGISHAYMKRLFITKEYEEEEVEADHSFIQASVWDNVFWCLPQLKEMGLNIDDYYKVWDEKKRIQFTLDHSDYAKTLASLPVDMKLAQLYGDWDSLEGQFFDLRRRIHVINPKDYLEWVDIRSGYRLIGSLDYGNDTCLTIHGIDNFGRVITFDELYHFRINRSQKIEDTKKFLAERGLEKLTIIADSNMFAKDGFDLIQTNTPAMEYMKAGIRLVIVSKTSPDKDKRYRVICNDTFKELLHFTEENGVLTKPPRYKVYARCKHIIQEVPTLIADPSDPEDIEGGQEDHSYDSVKYGVMALNTPKMKDLSTGKPNNRTVNKRVQKILKEYQAKNNGGGVKSFMRS